MSVSKSGAIFYWVSFKDRSVISALKNLWDNLIKYIPINWSFFINVFLSFPLTSSCPQVNFSRVFFLYSNDFIQLAHLPSAKNYLIPGHEFQLLHSRDLEEIENQNER